jgi:hypothetical protein
VSVTHEEAFIAVPMVTQIAAIACYNDPDARAIADKENLVDYVDADPGTQQFWRFIAATALNAAGHMELRDGLERAFLFICNNMPLGPTNDRTEAGKLIDSLRVPLAKARGDQ